MGWNGLCPERAGILPTPPRCGSSGGGAELRQGRGRAQVPLLKRDSCPVPGSGHSALDSASLPRLPATPEPSRLPPAATLTAFPERPRPCPHSHWPPDPHHRGRLVPTGHSRHSDSSWPCPTRQGGPSCRCLIPSLLRCRCPPFPGETEDVHVPGQVSPSRRELRHSAGLVTPYSRPAPRPSERPAR